VSICVIGRSERDLEVAFAIAACGMASKAATFYASKRPRTQSFIAKKEGIILLFRIFGIHAESIVL
jgi:hypothetical protein